MKGVKREKRAHEFYNGQPIHVSDKSKEIKKIGISWHSFSKCKICGCPMSKPCKPLKGKP